MANTDVMPELAWDYPLAMRQLGGVIREPAVSGRMFSRLVRPSLRQIELVSRSMALSDLKTLRAFYARLAKEMFIFRHPVHSQGSWNLLGLDAEAEHSGTAQFFYQYVGPYTVGGFGNLFRLSELGLKVGDALSLSAELKTSGAAGEDVKLSLEFRDSDGVLTGSGGSTPAEAGTTYVLKKVENFTVPANAVYFRVLPNHSGGTSETAFVRKAKLNRGAVALEFQPPFTASADPLAVYVPRFFPVQFVGEPEDELAGYDTYEVRLLLQETAGEGLLDYQYPDPLDGIETGFLEENDSLAAILAGTWNLIGDSKAHGENHRTNANTNTTDAFQWTYWGYGFRLWAKKNTNLGIAQVFLDGASLGNVDFYSASNDESAPVLTKLDVALALHTVKIQATNTRNGSSSANTIPADAVEAMA